MMQFEEVHIPHSDGALKTLTCTSIIQSNLCAVRSWLKFFSNFIGITQLEQRLNFLFVGTIKDRGGDGQATSEVMCHFKQLLISQRINISFFAGAVVGFINKFAQFFDLYLTLFIEHLIDAIPNPF